MKPERQRIAIAEACGLDVIYDPAGPKDKPEAWKSAFFTPKAAQQRRRNWPNSAVVKVIPDYLNDLNAMHEAEKYLGDRMLLYVGALEELLGVEEEPLSLIAEWTVIHATAAQKAEAFLKAMGTWEDEE